MAATDYMEMQPDLLNVVADTVALKEAFGSVPRSMFALYTSLSGGVNGGVPAAALSIIHPFG